MTIQDNILQIRRRMAQAAEAAGRDPKGILLCAATKMQDADAVMQAIAAGVDCCGENRVQELTAKQACRAYEGAPVHFIGRLQTNKIRQVVGHVSLIQSVDRVRLLELVQKEALSRGICQDVLLEINVGREQSKAGFLPEELPDVLENIGRFTNIRVKGLMAIPPVSREPKGNCKFFQEMHNLSVDIREKKYDNVSVGILSMGMTDDFEDAIASGSTMIRVGSGIFGPRNYAKPHP